MADMPLIPLGRPRLARISLALSLHEKVILASRRPGHNRLSPDISWGPGGYIGNDLIWIGCATEAFRFFGSRFEIVARYFLANNNYNSQLSRLLIVLCCNGLMRARDGPPNNKPKRFVIREAWQNHAFAKPIVAQGMEPCATVSFCFLDRPSQMAAGKATDKRQPKA
ncbi:MAG: hypothetical protein KQJ78_17105 [Deltaproteobacteria bacterium]|nr:hypothetical protein [Deltaproteobacteria bacterium]